MTKRHHIGRLPAAASCILALLIAGCGSDDEGKQLPASSVADIERSLDSIQRRFELGGGACRDITEGDDTDVSAVQSKIEALPADVDKDVRDALRESFDTLFRLVDDDCAKTETETKTETTPTETVPTVTETVPAQTETVPTETATTPTTTSPATGEGNDGNNAGKGKGKGGGNSGKGSGGAQAPGGD